MKYKKTIPVDLREGSQKKRKMTNFVASEKKILHLVKKTNTFKLEGGLADEDDDEVRDIFTTRVNRRKNNFSFF